MDTVQFLLSVVNLLLAMTVLFGGRLIFKRLSELREDVEDLKSKHKPAPAAEKETGSRSLEWKE
ncbi:MAG: hypothetical protein O3C45_01515 [Bacteroidetes bacterium]|nr:hypothetical protein [Bacteroidota bacterium]MDA0873716.1 hypothetical protein [Bacteroidota bacterium]